MNNTQYFFRSFAALILLLFTITNDLNSQNTYDIQTDGEVYRFGYSGGQDKYRDFLIPTDYDTINDFNQITFALRGGDGGRRRVAGICTEPGGKGAKVTASFAIGTEQGELAPGGTIRIIVGQQGGSNKSSGLSGAGGGGGSAVLYRPPGLSGDGDCTDYTIYTGTVEVPSNAWDTDCWILLAVAGGGGGAYAPGGCAQAASGKEGNAGENGTDGKGADVFGGQGGSYGQGGITAAGGAGMGYEAFNRNERDGHSGLLTGGESPDAAGGYVRGGFGYGSGGRGVRQIAVYGGGGGGGYSGGGGGGQANGGGGGGSFVNNNAVVKTKEDGGGTDRTPNNGYVSYLFEDNVDIVDAPVAVCRDTTINVVGEEGRVRVADLAIGSTDPNGRTLTYCAELSLGCVPNLSFNCGDIGEETIYTVRVDNGVHATTCQANIEVQQGIPGDLVCPEPETIISDDCGSVIISGFDLEIRDYPACDYTVDAYIVKPDGSIDTDFLSYNENYGVAQEAFDFGTSLLVYTVTYENEESIEESQSCVVTVNVIDDADSDFECSNNLHFIASEGECERLVTSNALSADYDGCGQLSYTITTSDINAPIVSDVGMLTSFNFPIGINTVEYTLNSVTGEVLTCAFTVEITAPYATFRPEISNCPDGDVLIDIYEGITQEEMLAQIDFEVSDDCGIASVHIANLDLSCDKVGVPQNNRSIIVTDTDGNTDDCRVDIITQSPSATISCPEDIIRFDGLYNNAVAAIHFSELIPNNLPTCYLQLSYGLVDLGNNSVEASGIGFMPTQILSAGSYEASYTLEQVENDNTNCTFLIEIVDCEAPPVVCQDAIVNLSELPANPADLLINQTDDCSLAYTTSISQSLDCDDVGLNTLIVTVTDDFGNESTCHAMLTIVNDILPEITTCPTGRTIYLDANCEVAIPDLTSEIMGTIQCGGMPSPVQIPEVGALVTTPGVIDVEVDLRSEEGQLSAAPCALQITILDNTAPTSSCQDVSVMLDENGEGTITLSDVDNGSFDGCGDVSLSFDATLDVTELGFDCTDSEVSPVTLYVKDQSGNQSNCIANATKVDNLAPSAVCVASLTIGLSESPLLATQLDGGSTDNCTAGEDLDLFMVKVESGSPSGAMTNLACSDIGDLPIILYVTDQAGNESSCTVTVEVIDDVSPTANCQDITVNIEHDSEFITPGQINNGSNDVCGNVSLSLDRTNFSCADVGQSIEVTLSVNDGTNTSTCTGTVTVTDNTAPFVDCQAGIVNLDENGDGTLLASALNDNNGSTDACGPLVFSFDEAGLITNLDFDCVDVGQINDFVYATDANGNVSAPCPVTIFINDQITPNAVCMNNLTVGLSESPLLVGMLDGGSTDNCTAYNDLTFTMFLNHEDSAEPVLLEASHNLSCADIGTLDMTLEVKDESNNTSTCDIIVTVVDDIAPTALCQDITVNIEAGPITITSDDIDNGSSDNCGSISLSLDHTEFGCADVGQVINVTLTANDGTNTSTCVGTVTVTDNTAPFVDCQAGIVNLDASGNGTLLAIDLNDNNGSTDACGPLIFSFDEAGLITSLDFDCIDVGQINDFVYATDANGNVSAPCPVTIFVNDPLVPNASCVSALTVGLSETPLLAGQLDVGSIDNCTDPENLVLNMYLQDDATEVSTLIGASHNLTCSDVGTLAITLEVMDGSHNKSNCAVNVTVVDDIAPIALCQGVLVEFGNSNPTETITVDDVDNASSDLCSAVTLSFSNTELITEITYDCDDVGIQTVTLYVSDQSDNMASCNATVKVDDVTSPTMNCVTDLVIGLSESPLTVEDLDAGTTDNCTAPQDLLFNLSFQDEEAEVFELLGTTYDLTCADVGELDIVLTAIDANGEGNLCAVTISVVDDIAPTAVCQDHTIQLDAYGHATITTDDINNGSTDACLVEGVPDGIASFSLDVTDFDCSNVGSNTVMLTVTDVSGNSAACIATVTVVDITPPTAICKNVTVEIQTDGLYELLEADVFDGINSSDECGPVIADFPSTTFTCDEAGMTFVIPVTVSDASGNIANCTANIQVEVGEGLPDGWEATDIGAVTIGNAYSFDPCTGVGSGNGEFAITGSGNNTMGSTTDNIAFASQTICGDGMITAKIESVTPNGYGGLMIRETTDSGAKQVAVFSNLSNVLRHETRYHTNGVKQVNAFYKPVSSWLRLQRQGDWIFAYHSIDGANFQYVHGVFVPMQNCVEIGLASFTYLPNAQTDAVFSNVAIVGSNGTMGSGVVEQMIPYDNKPLSDTNVLNVFPNPANTFISISLVETLDEDAQVQIFNSYGQLVTQRNFQSTTRHMEWDISMLPAGNYIVHLESGSKQIVMIKKLVIVK